MEVNEDKLDKADKVLTKFGIVLKKHWGKLIILGLGSVLIWFCLLVKTEVENDEYPGPEEEQYYPAETYSDTIIYDDTL